MLPGRSEVRRLRLLDLEQVRHQQPEQEWVPHWHEEWSFGAIVSGACRCSVAGQPFEARAGDLIAIAPGVVHTGALLPATQGAAVMVVMFYLPAIWVARSPLAAAPWSSARTRAPGIARDAASVATAAEAERWIARAIAACNRSRDRVVQVAPSPRPPERVQALIRQVQAAVRDGESTVAGLAGRCGISRERLHRVLRRWVGMSPADYLRAVRIHRARELLLAGHAPAEVSAAYGFADQAHFTRWFRKTFGYTPGDLQRAHRATAAR